jgi:NADH-quinone oxidoreductase subunit G
MAKIVIDHKEYEARDGRNFLEVCLEQGLNLPYFCWHPKLGSVGACRQCAVKEYKDENDTKGKISMACMIPVREGARISLDDPEVKQFRSHIIESLMTNHPHDCPTCDEGGQCHLQDMTVMTGHNYRNYRFLKRTFRNQNLGPFINHEMNRCITCYRCVRFYKDYAGGKDFDAFASHNHVYFGRYEEGTLENEFSGNLTEVCPTGVFTDKTLRHHYTRKWDLTSAPSVCNQCSAGCNTIASERYGSLRSITSRYNGEVNGYFLCDRGRFGYEYNNSEFRIKKAYQKSKGGDIASMDVGPFLDRIAQSLKTSKKIIGIGSPKASLESNFALKKLVGDHQFYTGMSDNDHQLTSLACEILRKSPARSISLREIEQSDAVFILGEDLTNTAPMLALAVRQSVRQRPMERPFQLHIPLWNDKSIREIIQDEKGPLFIATPANTPLDDVATRTYHASADGIARLGFAVAHELDEKAPFVKGLPAEILTWAKEIASALKNARNPLVIGGTSCGSEAILKAAASVSKALCTVGKKTGLSLVLPEANSLGLALMGGKRLSEAFVENADTVIILENNLFRRTEETGLIGFLKKVKTIVALDYFENETTLRADYVVPVAPLVESGGTLVNNEGRAQQFFQVYMPEHSIQPSWRWLQAISSVSGIGGMGNREKLADFTRSVENEYPVFAGISTISPPPGYRVAGQKIPREPHRYSGRTAMYANINVHEPEPPRDDDTPLSYTMEGFIGEQPSPDVSFFWWPGWNSVQAINKYQIEIGGHLHGGDPGKRLIEPHPQGLSFPYHPDIPQPYKPEDNVWLILPLYHIFGSEELSGKSKTVTERIPKPYVALNAEDINRFGLVEGMVVELTIDGRIYKLPLIVKKGLSHGMAGLPVGLPRFPFVRLPNKGTIKEIKTTVNS